MSKTMTKHDIKAVKHIRVIVASCPKLACTGVDPDMFVSAVITLYPHLFDEVRQFVKGKTLTTRQYKKLVGRILATCEVYLQIRHFVATYCID